MKKMRQREYEVVAINDRTKREYIVCLGPFSVTEAYTVRSKFNTSKHARLLVREISK